ncbi:MAG: DASS family sodium-coupled anion symporter [Acidobacteriota bacterium]|nr:DASS family sodium-coupled anion symporter [Acidobacteriota bacterium]
MSESNLGRAPNGLADVTSSGHKTTIGIAGAITAAILVLLLPSPADLPPEAQRLGAIFLAAIILWATEALPIAVTALLVIVLQPLLRVAELDVAFKAFVSPVFFFVLAMFCIAAAVTNAGLDRRFAYWLLARAGTDSRRVVIALIVGTAATSMFISDVPACAIFMSIGLGVMSRLNLEPGKSAIGKAIMVGIPIGSLIGGVTTPAGSSVNILGLHFIEEFGNVTVSFVEWMAIGIPMSVGLVPVACWAILRCFPPEIPTIGDAGLIERERAELGPMSAPERKAVTLLATMMVLWIAGSWIEFLDVLTVGLGGAILMFFPGIQLLTWKQAERATGWDTMLMIGGVTSLGTASVNTGLATWLVGLALGGVTNWHIVFVLLAISAFTVVIHLALPIGPVVNAVVIPPIALLAIGADVNPALYALPVAFTASCAFLLPLDAVALLTYSRGYYRMHEMLAPGALVSAVWIIWMTVIMLVVGPFLGFV